MYCKITRARLPTVFFNNLAASMAKRLRWSSLFDSLKKPRNSEVAGVSGCMPESTDSKVEQDEVSASEELVNQPLDQSEFFFLNVVLTR